MEDKRLGTDRRSEDRGKPDRRHADNVIDARTPAEQARAVLEMQRKQRLVDLDSYGDTTGKEEIGKLEQVIIEAKDRAKAKWNVVWSKYESNLNWIEAEPDSLQKKENIRVLNYQLEEAFERIKKDLKDEIQLGKTNEDVAHEEGLKRLDQEIELKNLK